MSAVPTGSAGAPYRAALVKRRSAPQLQASVGDGPTESAARVPAGPTAEERAAALQAEHARRVKAEIKAVRRVEAMTEAWNDELSSTVPAIASVVSRAVREIVGEAPREDVVATAVRREVARVRGEHRPTLRVARADGEAWIDRLRERAARNRREDEGPLFAVRPDDALAPGKCVLEIGSRRIDLTPEAQLDAFDDALRNGVGALPPRAAPALPEVAEPTPRAPEAPIVVPEAPIVVPDAATPTRDEGAAEPNSNAARPVKARKAVSRSVRTAKLERPSEEAPRPEPTADPEPAEPAKAATRERAKPEDDGEPRAEVKSEVSATERKPIAAGSTEVEVVPAEAEVVPVAAEPSMPPADAPIDFDALDLGEGAARYEVRPPVEAPGAAPWVGAVVSAPDLSGAPGGSRAVAALRERVARTAGELRRGAGLDEAVSPADAPTPDLAPDEPSVLASSVPPASTSDEASEAERKPSEANGEPDRFPPFAHGARAARNAEDASGAGDATSTEDGPTAADRPAITDAGKRPVEAGLLGRLRAMRRRDGEPTETSAPSRAAMQAAAVLDEDASDRAGTEQTGNGGDEPRWDEPGESTPARRDPIATGGDGSAVRAAIAGARRRAVPPALDTEDGDHPEERAALIARRRAEPRDGEPARATRLPPRIAELIASQRERDS